MNKKFTEDTLIADALDTHEGVADVLKDMGLPCFRCAVAEYETIAEGARCKELEVAEVLARLNALLTKDKKQADSTENGQESTQNK